ncbi:hypothetical protein [Streptomyces sp. NBC_00151]|uniref:hypothetical protein n=1 Tax=Streptomyces sp. NBC_00151 TaxID=2975669 RepID=UPI002DD94C95|nr:hypothetical protein [Streptomyces sp. NBC_00151]WRZ41884.1 hypothetical protein OG915_29895 [Streptomyces sp. NBC_00151]
MHTRTTTAVTAVLLLATVTACSSSSTDNKPRTASAKTTSRATASTAAKTSPLKIGTGHHWSDTDTDGSHISGTTTVMGYTQPIKMDHSSGLSDFAHPVWATLDVKLCADSSSTTVMSSQSPWALGFPDDTRIQAPFVSGAGVPKPEYPLDGAAVKAGTCLRGKITFSMERGTRPNQIIYGPEGRDPVEWAVPKA